MKKKWPKVRTGSLFLLTPLREGRREAEGSARGAVFISTHAPAGGATDTRHFVRLIQQISTHAPAGGATILRLQSFSLMAKFLLTPLREGRRQAHPNNFVP